MKAVIQSGIKTVVYLNELTGDDWTDFIKATMTLADLAGVEVRKFTGDHEIIDYLRTKVNWRGRE